MARIGMVTLNAPGHLFPFLAISEALSKHNHSVDLFLIPAVEEGISFEGFDAGDTHYLIRQADWCRAHPVGPSVRAYRHASFIAFGEPLAARFERIVATNRFDFLLVDSWAWGCLSVAEASTLPWAAVALDPLLIRGTGFDLRGPGFPPSKTFLRCTYYRLYDLVTRQIEAVLLKAVNSVRVKRNLPPLHRRSELYLTPPLTFAATAEPFEYHRSDWPPSLQFVGCLDWEPPTTQESQELVQRRSERPLVLLAGSSIPRVDSARAWATKAIRILGASQRYDVLATLPKDVCPQPQFPNISVARFLSHRAVLPHASCVVTHGGAGITNKALAYGVPVVAVPSLYEFEVSRRIEVAGVGIMLPASKLTAKSLLQAISGAIERRGTVNGIAQSLQRAGGPKKVVEEIERRLLCAPIAVHRSCQLG